MPRFAPRLATKDAISPGTPLERRLRTVTGIVPMLLSEVNATTPVGQYALKNGIGLRRVVTDRMSGCTMNSCRIIATYATTSTVTSGSSAATSLLLTAAAISASTAYGVNPTTICVALDSTTLPHPRTLERFDSRGALGGLGGGVVGDGHEDREDHHGHDLIGIPVWTRFVGNSATIVSSTAGTSRCW